ncbi:MAG: YgjV family protein [Clostridia bacterium]|nr:YgjV family protein [Clostridia bacterium]
MTNGEDGTIIYAGINMRDLLFSVSDLSKFVVSSLEGSLGIGYPILYNAIGAISIIIQFLIFQMRKKKQIVLVSIMSSVGWISYFALQGDFISCTSSIIGIMSKVIILLGDKRKFARSKFWNVFFVVFAAGFSALTFKRIEDIFPTIGSLLSISAFFMSKEKNIRIISLFSYCFFLLNSVSKFYIVAMIADITALISIIISLVRYGKQNPTEVK